jgi:hypothetical protein
MRSNSYRSTKVELGVLSLCIVFGDAEHKAIKASLVSGNRLADAVLEEIPLTLAQAVVPGNLSLAYERYFPMLIT